MKKILFIVLLCSCYMNAQDIPMRRGWMPDKEKQINLFAGFDIANAFVGGHILHNGERRNDRAFDVRLGGSFAYGKDQFSVFLEHFDAVQYYAAGLQYDRILPITRHLQVLLGAEGMWVDRDLKDHQKPPNYVDTKYFNWGLNLKVQLVNLGRFGAGVQSSLVWRSDIKKIWGRDAMPSGTLPAMWEHRSVRFYVQYKILSDR